MNKVMKNTGKPPRSRSPKPHGSSKGPGRGAPGRPGKEEPRRNRHSAKKDHRGDSPKGDFKRDTRGTPKFQNGADRKGRSRDVTSKTPPAAKQSPKPSLGPRPNIFGLHAVREAWLNPKRSIHALYLTEQTETQFAGVLEAAHRKGLIRPDPKILGKDDFDRLLPRDSVHQGAAMSAAPIEETFVQDIISIGAEKERSVVLLLDQVTDPHNVGAILRSACAFGADGVVMQRRHAPELEGIVAKTASGAADHIPVAYETNLSRTLEELAAAGYTVIGLDEHSDQTLSNIEIPAKAVLVLGAEGDGMRRLIREHCDVLVTLPTQKPINSLNVSNAAAVALYALLK